MTDFENLGDGELAYGDFVLGGSGSALPQLRLASEPVYDEAGGRVTAIRYTLSAASLLFDADESALAARVDAARQKLALPNQRLKFSSLGVGDDVGPGSASPEMGGGVKPLSVELTPIAGALAWQLVWKCEFTLAATGSRGIAGGILAVNYSQTIAIDENGRTTRTVAGYLEIAGVGGLGASSLTNGQGYVSGQGYVAADQARERIRVVVPRGFQRTKSEWTESADKRRLDFVIVDVERGGGPLPAGIAEGALEFSLEGAPAVGRTLATLDGFMEATADRPATHALATLLSIALDRQRKLQTAARAGTVLTPSRVRVSRQLLGRRFELRIEYELLRGVGELLTQSGLWTPVEGPGESAWQTSLAELGGPHANRGIAGLSLWPEASAVVAFPPMAVTIAAGQPSRRVLPEAIALPALIPPVQPSVSWLEFSMKVTADREENVSVRPLALAVSEGGGGSGLGPAYQVDPTGGGGSSGGAHGFVREVHGPPRQTVTLSGEAKRVGFLPDLPELSAVAGRPAWPRKRVIEREQHGEVGGQPVHVARWKFTYDVPGYLAELPSHSSGQWPGRATL